MTNTLTALVLFAVVAAVASASCTRNADCPSSYCKMDATKKPPYSCQTCGDNCCLTDMDCKGSYCVNGPDKTPPFVCHGSSTSFELLVQKAVVANKAATQLAKKASNTDTAATPAPAAPANPLSPAAAKDAKIVEDFLKKYQQAVAGVAIAIGFVFAFAGYRYFSATLFLCGAAAAGFVSFVLIDYYQPNYESSKPVVVLTVTLALALLAGLLCVYLRKIGTFFAGAAGGASCAFMVNAAVLNKISAPSSVPGLYLYLAIVLFGMAGGLLALKVERLVIVLSTSLAGSLAFVAGIGHFAKHFPTSASSFIDPTTHEATHDVWVWAYAAGFVVMVIAGTVVQLKTTVDRNKTKKEEQYKNSLLYAAPTTNAGNRSVYVDHVSGYNTAV